MLLVLTDDPFDPPGVGRFGGSHAFFFDLGRELVRAGHAITVVTRRNHPDKPLRQNFGPLCRVRRLPVGPPDEVDHHGLGELLEEFVAGVATVMAEEHRFDIIQTSNWLSGATARLLQTANPPWHVHHVLSLGRARLELGEEAASSD